MLIRLVADRKHQRAKVLARSARFSVTDYHNLLLMHRLELEPFSRALARVVESRSALGDQALLVRSLRLGELALTKLGDVLAKRSSDSRGNRAFKSSFRSRSGFCRMSLSRKNGASKTTYSSFAFLLRVFCKS